MLIFAGFGFILGLILGSLVECLAERSVSGKSFWGRSYCEKCQTKLHWYDLFPVLSFLVLRGRCRNCHTKIPKVTISIEIFMGLLIAVLFYFQLSPTLLSLPVVTQIIDLSNVLFLTFVCSILTIFVITDLKTGLIPDRISLPAIVIALIYLIASTVAKIYWLYSQLNLSEFGKYLLPPHSDYFTRHALLMAEPLTNGLIAMAILVIFFGGLIFFTRGRGMGGGDLKMAALIGLATGVPNFILAIFLAFFSGAIVGVGLLSFGKRRFGQTIPFGPFLALGTILTLLWGDKILNLYYGLHF